MIREWRQTLDLTGLQKILGKSIAAYERHLIPGESRFDQYAEAVLKNDYKTADQIFSPEEVAGLKLFIGAAHYTNCHNRPLFTIMTFTT